MQRSPIFKFKNRLSPGIYNIPLASIIVVQDSDGQGTSLMIELISKQGLTYTSTVGDLLDNPDLYEELIGKPPYLEELQDTDIDTSTLEDEQPLVYNESTGMWINKMLTVDGGSF
jgi:hypothetical protein